ncbi:MAG: hypothetical protein GWP08_15695 [Nitrospiraceae bacterium]|nr:hypothetical protein [Nitrospiraceae bacterium]
MNTLLQLQALDLRIEAFKAREAEIPKQKNKFDIHRKRLADEIAEREEMCKRLVLEQRECETDIEQRQTQIAKYDQQLFAVKKNEEYQALLHEMEMLKKQISLKEERILATMVEADDLEARLEEDKKRVEGELAEIERQCAEIDRELAEARKEREALEEERRPLAKQADPELLARYDRIRTSMGGGRAVVPLNVETCSGCHMRVLPQVVNELMAGDKMHACAHCGRILFHRDNYEDPSAAGEAQAD